MGVNPLENTASTGTMTRIVKEIPKMISTTMEWTRTRASKKIFIQAFILLTTFVSFLLFTSQTVIHRFIIVLLYQIVKTILSNASNIHGKFLLLSLRIYKSHFV